MGRKTGEGRIEELVGDQNLDPEALPRSKTGPGKREQRCQGKNDVEG